MQGPDADGKEPIFTVGAHRDRRDSTNEALITDQRHTALRSIGLITPPSSPGHLTSSRLLVVISGMPSCSHEGLPPSRGHTDFCLTWIASPWNIECCEMLSQRVKRAV